MMAKEYSHFFSSQPPSPSFASPDIQLSLPLILIMTVDNETESRSSQDAFIMKTVTIALGAFPGRLSWVVRVKRPWCFCLKRWRH